MNIYADGRTDRQTDTRTDGHIDGKTVSVTNMNTYMVLACPDGFFGPQCVNKCNSTCYGCNIISGSCENGCLPGWKGNYCHEIIAIFYYYSEFVDVQRLKNGRFRLKKTIKTI